MSQQSRVIFSFDNDEIMPLVLGWGHGLKHENMCFWETISCEKRQDGGIKECVKKALYKNALVDIFLTFVVKNGYDILERGIVKVNNKECNIIDCRSYYSLQIGEYCYDNICVIRLPCNIFESSGISTTYTTNNTSVDRAGIANIMTVSKINS